MSPEPVEAPPCPRSGGASRRLRGLMIRDLALLLVKRPKTNMYFLVNVPPPEAFSAQNALNIVWPGPARGAYSAPQTPR